MIQKDVHIIYFANIQSIRFSFAGQRFPDRLKSTSFLNLVLLAANLAAASLVFLYLNTLQTRATRIPYHTTRCILEARRQYVTTLSSFVC